MQVGHDMFGAQAERDGTARGRQVELAGGWQDRLGDAGDGDGAVGGDTAGQEVHLGRPDEACDEKVGGGAEDLGRGAGLFDPAVAHDDDLVGQRHRLDLVMGDVDHGVAQAAVEFLDLGPHLVAQLGVEVRERLVEEEDARFAHHGAAHGDALALAAGQLAGPAVEIGGEFQNLHRLGHAAVDFGARQAGDLQPEGEVGAHAHVRIEGVGLEHHRHAAAARGDVVDDLSADADVAPGDGFEPGDHAQRGGLAAARGADEGDEGLVLDGEVDPLDGDLAPVGLDEVGQPHLGHQRGVPGGRDLTRGSA